jgi:hypothetical protein
MPSEPVRKEAPPVRQPSDEACGRDTGSAGRARNRNSSGEARRERPNEAVAGAVRRDDPHCRRRDPSRLALGGVQDHAVAAEGNYHSLATRLKAARDSEGLFPARHRLVRQHGGLKTVDHADVDLIQQVP